MKKMLIALALLVVSSPLYAQSTPVQIVCSKGGYGPACNSLKQAVNQSPFWHQSKSGPRYVVFLNTLLHPDTPQAVGAASFAAVLSDPLSSVFPYHIDEVAFYWGTGVMNQLGPALVEELTLAAIGFAETVNSRESGGLDLSDVEEKPMRFLTDKDFAGQSDE
jgi:hypothetical protein